MPERLAAHHEIVRAAICDGLADEPLAEAGALRGRLVAGLGPVVTTVGPPELVVDGWALSRVGECPASYAPEEFGWTATRAARSLGLRALRAMTSPSRLGVADAVAVVVDEAIGEGYPIGRWLAAQDGAARGATVAAALSWACRAWVAVPWGRLGTLNVLTTATRARPLGRAGWLTLRGKPDVIIQPEGGRADDPRQVLLRLGRPSPVAVGLDALVLAMSRGAAPLRVVTVHPASGHVGVADVDRELLRAAVDSVVAWVGPGGDRSVEQPGTHCWRCVRREECVGGGAWMKDRTRRIGGIPLGAGATGGEARG